MDFYKNEDYFRCFDRGMHPSTPVEGLSYTVVTDLATEPVDITFFKQHARIDFNTDDNLITAYIKAARQYLEQYTQLSFGQKTIRFMALKVPNKWKLMFGYYDSITTLGTGLKLFGDILMRDGNHDQRGLTDIDIELKTKSWVLPENVKIAICKQAAWLYISRESIVTSNEGAIQRHEVLDDEAKVLLRPLMNISWP